MSSVSPAAIRIDTVRDAATRAAWLKVPYTVFKDDPAWVAPLKIMEDDRFKPSHPFFSFSEVCLFIAYKGAEPVGRISAQVNRRHLETHKDGVGHFGFFDCIDDQAVAQALVDAAAAWLTERGLAKMVGPLNFSTNEESGLLVDGFDTPPAIMMTHARPWFGTLLERAGLAKEIDLYAYRVDPNKTPEQVARLAAKAQESGRITVRHLDTRRLAQEIEVLVDIFNDAWSQNWGFVPFARPEIDAMIAELKLLFRSNYGRFIDVDGRPSAVMIGLPDINSVIRGFNGNLLPLNWARLLPHVIREDYPGARIPLMGIRREFQHTAFAAGILAVLAREFLAEARTKKLKWVEFSWVLESNKAMNALGRLAAGAPVKTFRVYAKPLQPAA